MNLDFFNKETHLILDDNTIKAIEQELSITLPMEIKEFLINYNHCKTDKSVISIFEDEYYKLNQINDMKKVLNTLQIWRDDGYPMVNENEKILPFARIGNTAQLCFVFDKNNNYYIGYFHVHDIEFNEETNTFDDLFYVTDSLESLLNSLKYPSDYVEPYLKEHDNFEIDTNINKLYNIKKIENIKNIEDINALGLAISFRPYIFLKKDNQFICYEQIEKNKYIQVNKTLDDFESNYYQKIVKIKTNI